LLSKELIENSPVTWTSPIYKIGYPLGEQTVQMFEKNMRLVLFFSQTKPRLVYTQVKLLNLSFPQCF
jgi:hypothetical protein